MAPTETDTPLRPELDALPPRMRDLPIDARGYPVPWFVAWVDGKPDHRVMDPRKWRMAIETKRCWSCGKPLGVHLAFVLGPMCGITRTTSEPPNHFDCATFSAVNCPFLSRPHMVRRVDEQMVEAKENSAGIPLDRNPGVVGIWITKRFSLFRDDKNRPLIKIGDPSSVLWFSERRLATREEVLASVQGGLPFLEQLAVEDDRRDPSLRSAEHLRKQTAAFLRHIPAA